MSIKGYKTVFVFAVVFGTTMMGSTTASAAITVHNNLSDFLLARPASQFVEFPGGGVFFGVFPFSGGILQDAGSTNLLEWGDLPLGAPVNPRPATPWATVGGPDDFQWDFTNSVDAVAFDLVTNSTAQETVLFFDATNQLIESISIDALTTPNTAQFVGFSSTTPISRVVLNTSGGASQNEGIDDFYVGSVVPEPGTFALLAFIGLALLGRRRREQML